MSSATPDFPSVGERIRGEVMFSRDKLKAARLVVPRNGVIKTYRAPDDIVMVCTKGRGMIVTEDATYRINAGEVIDLSPNVAHTVSADDEMELIIVHARLS